MAVVQLADQRSVLAVLAAADSAKQLVAVLLQKTAEKLAFHSAEQLAAVVQPAVQSLLLLEHLLAVQLAVWSMLLPELPPAVQSAVRSVLLPEFLPAM